MLIRISALLFYITENSQDINVYKTSNYGQESDVFKEIFVICSLAVYMLYIIYHLIFHLYF